MPPYRHRLRLAVRRIALAEGAFGLAVAVGVLAAALLAGAGLESALWLPAAGRGLFFWAFFALAVGLAWWALVRPALRAAGVLPGLDERVAAARAGERFPAVRDRLTVLLDLEDGHGASAPAPLVQRARDALAAEVEGVPFERVEDLRPARRAAPAAAVPLLALAAFALMAPGPFSGAVERLFSPGAAFSRPAPFAWNVTPGDVEIVRGDTLVVEAFAKPTAAADADFRRALPATAVLEWGVVGEERTETARLTADSLGAFRRTLPNLRRDTRYRLTAGGVPSPWFTARVVSRPDVRALRVLVRPPRYSGQAPQALPPGVGDVTALAGSRVEVRLSLRGEPAASAALRVTPAGRDTTALVPLQLDGDAAEGAFTLGGDGAYTVHLVGRNGTPNADAVAYTLTALADAPPQIELLAPGPDAALSDDARVGLAARVTDDFGFSRLTLYWRLEGADRSGAEEAAWNGIPIGLGDGLDQEVTYEWLLGASGLRPRPGDAVAFFLEVRDNDGFRGHKAARTPTRTLRFPSVAEQYERLGEEQSEVEDALDRLDEDAERARERFEELRNDLRRSPETDWEDQRQLERLQEEQQRLQEQVRQTAEEMQDVLDEMRRNELVSPETMQLYEEMQRIMEEIATPELMEQLRQLQEAMESMDREQMMEALERFEFDEQQFRERLERAKALLERLQTAQQLDEVSRRAEAIAEEERKLQEATEALEERQQEAEDRPGGPTPEQEQALQEQRDALAAEQRRAKEEAEALEEALEELQEKMDAQRRGPAEQLEELRQQLEQQDVPGQMERNAQQLEQGQTQPAQQGQQQMQQQMQQLSMQMKAMAEEMREQEKGVDTSALRRILDDVLTLSERQEDLRGDAVVGQDGPALRPVAQRQVELASGLSTVSDSIRTVARRIPQLDQRVQRYTADGLREMGQATEALAERQAARAAGHQKAGMTHLNDLALLLSEVMDQLQQQGQGQGAGSPQMMQQLQQMGQQQQQLNQGLQQMLNDMQGQRLSQDQQGRMEQLRQQQRALGQQLQQMLEQHGDDLDAKARSDLRRIAEEMEAVARQLGGGRPSGETARRQEQILHRLLEAQDSLNQRGRDRRREREVGRDRPATPSNTPAPDTETDRLRRDLIRALEAPYAPDYQRLIKRYFERLQERARGAAE